MTNIFGAQSTAPSSLDSFTQLVINSSNFYARFLSFSREYDASGKRFREAEGEASPQSPPAGALLLKKKEKKEKKKEKREIFSLVTGFFSWSQEFFPWSQDFFLGHRISFLGHRFFFLVTGFRLGPKKTCHR